jgi:hypothetical protein
MFLLFGASLFRVDVGISMLARPEASRVEEGSLPCVIVSRSVVNPELVTREETDSVARR